MLRILMTKNTVLTRSPSYLRKLGIPVYSQVDLNGQKTYMMTAGAAYNYLEAFSNKRGAFNLTASVKDAASCPLMKLPNELLLDICRLVVKVTGHRLLVGNKSFAAYDEQTPIWASPARGSLTMPPVQDFLALLLMNRKYFLQSLNSVYLSAGNLSWPAMGKRGN
jgi:hypothetical protein